MCEYLTFYLMTRALHVLVGLNTQNFSRTLKTQQRMPQRPEPRQPMACSLHIAHCGFCTLFLRVLLPVHWCQFVLLLLIDLMIDLLLLLYLQIQNWCVLMVRFYHNIFIKLKLCEIKQVEKYIFFYDYNLRRPLKITFTSCIFGQTTLRSSCKSSLFIFFNNNKISVKIMDLYFLVIMVLVYLLILDYYPKI